MTLFFWFARIIFTKNVCGYYLHLTWVSVNIRLVATSNLFGLDRYLFCLNCFSSSNSCWEVKAVRGLLVFPKRAWLPGLHPVTIIKLLINSKTSNLHYFKWVILYILELFDFACLLYCECTVFQIFTVKVVVIPHKQMLQSHKFLLF